ncbi:hypothetical protein BIV24_25965 [Streptomyces colonosanans]|uniref:Pyridoxamine 5'-phosphate oxidase N-terminal domain-containing protein n=1 Tax=Streptomyces colonosanans TaxID=1428652 RepID=A0A1S2NZR0_9ACTN|nr:hypothetical protein BIV24_25965 [Streptomyces colonosanans]
MIRNGFSEVHAAFVGMQRLVVIGWADSGGRIWASTLTGPPGFARTTGPHSLSLVLDRTQLASPSGLLADRPFETGLLFPDRRTGLRLRVNGIARPTKRGLAVDTAQVFTNCPGRLRHWSGPGQHAVAAKQAVSGEMLSPVQQKWITDADTFFIATTSDTGTADASHRGGEPGSVKVVSPTQLVWAERSGNSMFTTLGNLAVNPRAGILFIDGRSGATLHLTGTTRHHLTGEEPIVHFMITHVVQTAPVDVAGLRRQQQLARGVSAG